MLGESPRSCAGVLWLLTPVDEMRPSDSNKPMSSTTASKIHQLSHLVLKDHDCPSTARLHEQSLQLRLDYRAWSASEYVEKHRDAVVAWLFPRCARLGFHDRWAIHALTLLDHFAATSNSHAKDWMPWDAFWNTMAAMLIAMKMCEAESNSGMSYKKMLTKLAFPSKHEQWWSQVRDAECVIICALSCRLTFPTALDLVETLASKVCLAASKTASNQWEGLRKWSYKAAHPNMELPLPRFTWLAMYIVELGLVHAARRLYETKVPPLAVAIAGLELSLYALGEPPERCDKELQALKKQVVAHLEQGDASAWAGSIMFDGLMMRELRKLLLRSWLDAAEDSPVVEKWRQRTASMGGPFPEPPAWLACARFRSLTLGRAWPGAEEDLPFGEPPRTPEHRSKRRRKNCEVTQHKEIAGTDSSTRSKCLAPRPWEDVWASLEKCGWRLEKCGKKQQVYYLPPNVRRHEGGARNRVHYFDSKKRVLAHLQQTEAKEQDAELQGCAPTQIDPECDSPHDSPQDDASGEPVTGQAGLLPTLDSQSSEDIESAEKRMRHE
mmetsp:Transcript_14850/g.33811  ORF Transcript_14850/g.33811 Transcript_14850/m.33811 type:complete len:552 (+) Transcript_14850:122-1777(+)